MSEISWDELETACWDIGVDPGPAISNYSGRGMYGDTCLGFIHDSVGELLEFVLILASNGYEDELIWNVRQDSMGLGTVTYWPNITITDYPEDDDDA